MKTNVYILAIFLALVSPVLAAEHRSGESVVIESGKTISEDFFAGSRYIDISGRVEGDVYAGGERILLDGEVTEDVLTGCRSLTISGKVGDGVIFFGQELIIEGEIDGDVKAFGADVRITPRAVINGDLFAAAGRLDISGGLIRGGVKGYVGETVLNGAVGENIDLEGGSVDFGPDFQSQGAVHLTLPEPLDADQAEFAPDNLVVEIREPKHSSHFPGLFGFLWSVAAAFIVGVVMVVFLKQTTRDFLDFARNRPLPKAGMGFVYLVVVPVAVLILFLMILTIPVALIATALYVIAVYLGSILASLAVGEWVIKRFRKDQLVPSMILSLIVGIVLVKILTHIPIIGWLITLAVVCYGLGSLVNFLWQYRSASEAGSAS